MKTVTIAAAKAHLGTLVDQLQAGDSVLITRRGKQVARLTPADRPLKPVDVGQLRALTDNMSEQSESAGDFIRRMRDDARY